MVALHQGAHKKITDQLLGSLVRLSSSRAASELKGYISGRFNIPLANIDLMAE
jgi:hypothetical protein